jgi:hypothetical protein
MQHRRLWEGSRIAEWAVMPGRGDCIQNQNEAQLGECSIERASRQIGHILRLYPVFYLPTYLGSYLLTYYLAL